MCWEVYMFTKLECAQKQHGTSTRSGMDVHVYCLRPKSLSAQVVTCSTAICMCTYVIVFFLSLSCTHRSKLLHIMPSYKT